MKFYKIELSTGEHLHADRKTKPLRFENGFHFRLTEGPVSVSVSRKHRRFEFFLVNFTDKNSHGSYLLLAPRLWKLLEAVGATGYFLRETDVKLGFEHEPWERDYRQMVITGWGGVAKGIHRVESYRGKQCYTLPDDPRSFFDTSQWDQGNRTLKHGKLLKDLLDSVRTEATKLTLATNIVFYGSVSLKNVKR